MLNTSGLLYLSGRAISAAGNLLAVVIFSRLAGPAEYGHYVLIFVYGFGAQWMRFAYFGVYKSERFGEYVGALARLLCAGLTIVAIVLTALGVFGFFKPGFLIAVFALVCGITLYEAAFEVARGAALSMILRAVLIVLFGGLRTVRHSMPSAATACSVSRSNRGEQPIQLGVSATSWV
jgi:hypothetical protein